MRLQAYWNVDYIDRQLNDSVLTWGYKSISRNLDYKSLKFRLKKSMMVDIENIIFVCKLHGTDTQSLPDSSKICRNLGRICLFLV
jgi:hypothetical protein